MSTKEQEQVSSSVAESAEQQPQQPQPEQQQPEQQQPQEQTTSIEQQGRESQPAYQKPHGKQASQREPTLEFFNQLVAKDTHCLLGRTGVKVSRVCLGTMNFGKIDEKLGERPGQLSEEEAHKILDRYLELGGNCIDTANFFPWFGATAGQTESIIGSWLNKCDREKVFLITKIRMPTDPENINSGGLSRVNILNSVKDCLKRLRTDYVDLLMLDGWDESVSVAATVRDLDELVKADKIRYYGVCDVKGWQLQKMLDYARMLNLHRCVCYEGEYNLFTRGCEWEIMEICKAERIGFFGYAPLKYGILTDDFAKLDKPTEGSRIESASRKQPNMAAMAISFNEIKDNPICQKVMDVCQQIAKNKNWSIEQVALLWALQRGFVTSVIVSVADNEELEECMNVLSENKCLSYEEMCQLNEASSFKLQYPYETSLTTFAGYKYISPDFAASFEQLSLTTPPSVAFPQEPSQLRQHPKETWHESKSRHLPEKLHQEQRVRK